MIDEELFGPAVLGIHLIAYGLASYAGLMTAFMLTLLYVYFFVYP